MGPWGGLTWAPGEVLYGPPCREVLYGPPGRSFIASWEGPIRDHWGGPTCSLHEVNLYTCWPTYLTFPSCAMCYFVFYY